MHIAHPQSRATVGELGEILERGSADLEQMLALQVALGTLAGDRRHELGAVLGQRRARAGFELPWMDGLEAAGEDPHPRAIQVQRPGDARIASGGIE